MQTYAGVDEEAATRGAAREAWSELFVSQSSMNKDVYATPMSPSGTSFSPSYMSAKLMPESKKKRPLDAPCRRRGSELFVSQPSMNKAMETTIVELAPGGLQPDHGGSLLVIEDAEL